MHINRFHYKCAHICPFINNEPRGEHSFTCYCLTCLSKDCASGDRRVGILRGRWEWRPPGWQETNAWIGRGTYTTNGTGLVSQCKTLTCPVRTSNKIAPRLHQSAAGVGSTNPWSSTCKEMKQKYCPERCHITNCRAVAPTPAGPVFCSTYANYAVH